LIIYIFSGAGLNDFALCEQATIAKLQQWMVGSYEVQVKWIWNFVVSILII